MYTDHHASECQTLRFEVTLTQAVRAFQQLRVRMSPLLGCRNERIGCNSKATGHNEIAHVTCHSFRTFSLHLSCWPHFGHSSTFECPSCYSFVCCRKSCVLPRQAIEMSAEATDHTIECNLEWIQMQLKLGSVHLNKSVQASVLH